MCEYIHLKITVFWATTPLYLAICYTQFIEATCLIFRVLLDHP
jgi:hypothetical protein